MKVNMMLLNTKVVMKAYDVAGVTVAVTNEEQSASAGRSSFKRAVKTTDQKGSRFTKEEAELTSKTVVR
jgi:hypothetical protein